MTARKHKRICIHRRDDNLPKEKSTKSRDKVLDHIQSWGEPDCRATFALLGEKGQATTGVCIKGTGNLLCDMFANLMDKREDVARFILFVASEYVQRHEDDEPNDNDK